MIKVKHYTDYKSFLSAYANYKRTKNKHWTLGVWTKQLGLKSTSSISKVISGERLPGKKIIEKLVLYFKFSTSDEKYFRGLIAFHKVKNDPELAVAVLEKLGKEHPNGSVAILEDSTFQILSNWYSFAVREVIRAGVSFKDLSLVSSLFNFKVNVKSLSYCLRSLKKAKLIEESESGDLFATSHRVQTQSDYASEAVKQYHEKTIALAKEAVRKISVEEREFQGTTLNINKENFLAAQEMLRNFRERFVKNFEETDGNQIYQMQIQFFPLTKEIKKEKK